MRSNKTILLVIAGVSGSIAALGVSHWMQAQGTATEKVQTSDIFVTVRDINLGDELSALDIKLEKWPLNRIPEGAVTNLDNLKGKYANQRMYAGEPLIARKLMDNAGNTRRDIPEGYSVVSFKSDSAKGVSTLIGPGDRVNVLAFFKKGGEIPETTSKVVLRDVRVYSVDGRTVRASENDGSLKAAKTVSLLIHSESEKAWLYAIEAGEVRLSLSRPEEMGDPGKMQGGSETEQEFLNWMADIQNKDVSGDTNYNAPTSIASKGNAEGSSSDRIVQRMADGSIRVFEMKSGVFVVRDSASDKTQQSKGWEVNSSSEPEGIEPNSDDLNGPDSPFFEDSGEPEYESTSQG